MGWTYTHRPKGQTSLDFFSQRFNYSQPDGKFGRIIDCKSKACETYIAYEIGDHTQSKVVALICLTRFVKGDYNFGYKDMDETMGPYSYDCPRSILDKLTPTDHEYALKWRRECERRLELNARLKPGSVVEFKEELSFGVWGSTKRFEAVDRRKGVFMAYVDDRKFQVKIPKSVLSNRKWEIVSTTT